MERLKGKIAMVVGAGSIGPGWGNGKATAATFAREGAQVFCVDRDALPLPQPGPIDPAPTTIAILPLSRSIDFSLVLSFVVVLQARASSVPMESERGSSLLL